MEGKGERRRRREEKGGGKGGRGRERAERGQIRQFQNKPLKWV